MAMLKSPVNTSVPGGPCAVVQPAALSVSSMEKLPHEILVLILEEDVMTNFEFYEKEQWRRMQLPRISSFRLICKQFASVGELMILNNKRKSEHSAGKIVIRCQPTIESPVTIKAVSVNPSLSAAITHISFCTIYFGPIDGSWLCEHSQELITIVNYFSQVVSVSFDAWWCPPVDSGCCDWFLSISQAIISATGSTHALELESVVMAQFDHLADNRQKLQDVFGNLAELTLHFDHSKLGLLSLSMDTRGMTSFLQTTSNLTVLCIDNSNYSRKHWGSRLFSHALGEALNILRWHNLKVFELVGDGRQPALPSKDLREFFTNHRSSLNKVILKNAREDNTRITHSRCCHPILEHMLKVLTLDEACITLMSDKPNCVEEETGQGSDVACPVIQRVVKRFGHVPKQKEDFVIPLMDVGAYVIKRNHTAKSTE